MDDIHEKFVFVQVNFVVRQCYGHRLKASRSVVDLTHGSDRGRQQMFPVTFTLFKENEARVLLAKYASPLYLRGVTMEGRVHTTHDDVFPKTLQTDSD